MHPTTPPARLPRLLGLWMATAIVIGTTIGSGVFKKPQIVAENVPHFGVVCLVWVVAGLLTLLGALAYAEVAVLFPRAGGNYAFLREGYGRMAGFLWGWVDFLIIRTGSIAALATIFTESLHSLIKTPEVQQLFGFSGNASLSLWGQRLITILTISTLALVNVRGVRWGGGLQLVVTAVKVTSLVSLALAPILLLRESTVGETTTIGSANFAPIWPESWTDINIRGLGTAFLGVLWAYHGWMNIAPVAEEVTKPNRNIPLSLLAGVLCVITLYVSAQVAFYLVIPGAEMATMKDAPVATHFGKRLLGSAGATLASLAVLISVFGSLNGNLLVGPRLLYAMAEDRLVPKALATVHSRFRTPALAILVLAGWSCLMVVGLALLNDLRPPDAAKTDFDTVTDFAMFGAVIFETLAVLSIFVFRWKLPNAERPYRCLGYPVVPIVYVVLPGFVLVNMLIGQAAEAMIGLGFIAVGAVVYVALGLGRSYESAQLWPLPDVDDQSNRDTPKSDGIQHNRGGIRPSE